jgi:hypothetical protein
MLHLTIEVNIQFHNLGSHLTAYNLLNNITTLV